MLDSHDVVASIARPKETQKNGGEKEVMNMRKNQTGITLIALIITIIILVILAAVSIRAVYNMGIVGHAINGTQQYAQRAVEENVMFGETTSKIDEAVAKVKEIQNGGSNAGGNGTGTGGNEQSAEAPDLLKTYVLGAAVNGVRPGKSLFDILNMETMAFIDDENSIEHASTELTMLNMYSGAVNDTIVYAKYNNDAYRITASIVFGDLNESTSQYDMTVTTTEVVKVYEPDANSRVGRVVQYKANASDETATDWLVLYDNGTTLDIMSKAEMGSYALGYNDPKAIEALPSGTNLERAQNSYENAVTRLNTYCGTLVTNSTAQKVRSVGTQFDITDTTAKYSSTFLANNPVNHKTQNAGDFNEVGLTGDMNGEQDVVRMSYYSAGETYQTFGYATTTNPYWLASRFVNEGPDGVYFDVRFVIGGSANIGNYLWIVDASGAYDSNVTFAVRPVVRVAVGNVSGL